MNYIKYSFFYLFFKYNNFIMKKIIIHILPLSEVKAKEEEILSYIDEERRKKTSSYLSFEKRLESLASSYFIKRYTSNLPLKYTDYGKPYKDGEYFSISHSQDYACFIQTDRECGIDIEKIRPIKEKLFSYLFSNEDKKIYRTDSDFIRVWTRKEALIKCEGKSVFTDLKIIPSHDGEVLFDGDKYYIKTIQYLDYMISVCLFCGDDFGLEFYKEELPF